MTSSATGFSDYLELYQYLSVLSEEQILKLRKVAIGVLDMSVFSKEEIHELDEKRMMEAV